LPRTVYPPLPADPVPPQYRWKNVMTSARDLRRVQSHSILGSTGVLAQAKFPESLSCDMTPRPGDLAGNAFVDPHISSFAFGGGLDYMSDCSSGYAIQPLTVDTSR
jgi:hypothetical protein